MVATLTPKTVHDRSYASQPNLFASELARHELMYMLHFDVAPRFLTLFKENRASPLHVILNDKVIMPHLESPLSRYKGYYKSYDALHENFNNMTNMLARTACNLKFTQLMDGLYVGTPKLLYALWTHNERALPPPSQRDGLGTKMAYVKFSR